MREPTGQERPPRTLLEQLIRQREATYEDQAKELAISTRHLQRLAAGERTANSCTPAIRRVLSKMYGYSVDDLLGPPVKFEGDVDGGFGVAANAAIPIPAEITIATRGPDGRITFVSIPRRAFLQGLGATALASQVGISDMAPSNPRLAELANDSKPIAHFRQLRRVLVDNDNLFGPKQVIPVVRQQMRLLDQIRRNKIGLDHRELLQMQAQFAEFCGWLTQDIGDHTAAQYWLDRALEWSHVAADEDLAVFVLARKSQLASDMGNATDAVALANTALRKTRRGSRLGAVAATYAARGYALSGDGAEAERAYERAYELLDAIDPADPAAWGGWLDDAYIAVHRARSLVDLGQYAAAAEGFERAIAALPAGYHRDCGVYTAQAALAYACREEADQAAIAGMRALVVARETQSGRILVELARAAHKLAGKDTATVIEFRDAYRELTAA